MAKPAKHGLVVGIDWASVPDSHVVTCVCGDPDCTAMSERGRITTNKTGGIMVVSGATSPDDLEITAHAVDDAAIGKTLRDDCPHGYEIGGLEHCATCAEEHEAFRQQKNDEHAAAKMVAANERYHERQRDHIEAIKRQWRQEDSGILTGFRSLAMRRIPGWWGKR